MCYRIVPVHMTELQEALALWRESGHARIPRDAAPPKDAFPGSRIPTLIQEHGTQLEAREFIWGFSDPFPGRQKRIYNTRLETALSQLEVGKGMWVDPIVHGRCLVPVRAFYEVWTEAGAPPEKTFVRFQLEGYHVFLLAGVCSRSGELSLVTTKPNKAVAPIHKRMPLVLGPHESSVWMGPGFSRLADRSNISLSAHRMNTVTS